MTHKYIKRAIGVALVVGSLLNAINSYDVFWNGNFTVRNTIRIVLTYITPFCVSLYSSIKANNQASDLRLPTSELSLSKNLPGVVKKNR